MAVFDMFYSYLKLIAIYYYILSILKTHLKVKSRIVRRVSCIENYKSLTTNHQSQIKNPDTDKIQYRGKIILIFYCCGTAQLAAEAEAEAVVPAPKPGAGVSEERVWEHSAGGVLKAEQIAVSKDWESRPA